MVRWINSLYFLQISHVKKLYALCLALIVGFIGFGIGYDMGTDLGMVVVLASGSLIGCATSIATATILGFMKCFPGKFVLGYSAGSGFSGISGAGCVLLFKTLGISIPTVEK